MRYKDLRPAKIEHAIHSEAGGWDRSVPMFRGIHERVVRDMERSHPGYKPRTWRPIIGRWHYIYNHLGVRVSLVEIDAVGEGYVWEACSSGALFEGERRWQTKKEAEKAIYKMFFQLEKRLRKKQHAANLSE